MTVCDETGGEVILMKDKSGRVIGFERPNDSGDPSAQLRLAFETLAA